MHARLLLKQLATWRLLYVIALLASLSFFGVNAFDTYEPTVKSDKEDYAPGEVAIISGYGWTQDSLVDVHLEEDPAHDHHHEYHDTKVNPDGSWRIEYPIEDRHLGVAFTVIVVGKQSGVEARTYFTDGRAEISNASPTPFSPNQLSSIGLNDNTIITAWNNGAGNIQNFVIRIRQGAINGTVVYQFDPFTLPAGNTTTRNWDGTYNQGANSGNFVPDGVYYVIAATQSGQNINETTSPVSTYKTVLVDNTNPSVTINQAANQVDPTVSSTINFRLVFSEPVTDLTSSDITLSGTAGATTAIISGTGQTYNVEVSGMTANGTVIASIGAGVVHDAAGNSNTASTSNNNVVNYTGACRAPHIETHPINQTITYGAIATFNVSASGTGSLTYQWEEFISSWNPIVDGGMFSGTATATLMLTKPTVAMSGRKYRVVVTGACSPTATSDGNATLSVSPKTLTPSITVSDKHFDGSSTATITSRSFGTGEVVDTDDVNLGTSGSAVFVTENAGTGKTVNITGLNLSGTTADNYDLSSTSTTTIANIHKAPTTTVVTINGGPFTYTGSAITPATVSVTGAGGLDITPDAAYSNNTNAGTATASFSFAETANYLASADSKSFEIGKKAASVTPTAVSVYCGKLDPIFTGNLSGFIASDNVTATYLRVSGSEKGTYSISATLSPATVLNNYNIVYNTATFTINGLSIDASASSTPVQVGNSATLSAKISVNEPDVAVTFTVFNESGNIVFNKTENTTSGTDQATAITTVPSTMLSLGVYKVVATVGTGCASSTAYIPVFDLNGEFVTGGGWILSPEGAYAIDPELVGKANFGFVSKYKKGSTQVDGNTEFQFHAGNLNFKSTLHESGSLVISGGKATYRGSGILNGVAGYKFTLIAIDGNYNGGTSPDKFRIKISGPEGVVYDNGKGADENSNISTDLGGGSIVIHENKSVGKTTTSSKLITEAKPALEQQVSFFNYPNSFADRTTIAFSLSKEESYSLEVYDVKGALVKNVSIGVAEADKLYEFEVDGRSMAEGIYIARLVTSSNSQSIKMILKK